MLQFRTCTIPPASPTVATVSTNVITEQKKLRRTGNSSGVTLSKKVLAAAGISAGEEVTVVATAGRIIITPADGAAQRTRAAGQAVLEQYRYAFERLGHEGRMP